MVICEREQFARALKELSVFTPLWNDHGIEVRGKPMKLDLPQYYKIEKEGRLIWIVAREDGLPIGYSCHFWYRDRHFVDDRVAADDIWYVKSAYRKSGIGRRLKEIAFIYLIDAGVLRTSDLIRGDVAADLMDELGYYKWGNRWIKEF